MTRARYMADGKASAFSEWLRRLEPPLDATCYSSHNLDYIWHQYRQSWLVTIEEKTHFGQTTVSQDDTHSIVSQMLAASSGMVCKTLRGSRAVEYRGHYVIRFSKTDPSDSQVVEINGAVFFDAERAVRALLTNGRQPEEQEEAA